QREGGGRLAVELGAVGDRDLTGARVDGEGGGAAATGNLPVLQGRSGVRVCRGDGADTRGVGTVLRERERLPGRHHRRFVHVGQVDGHRLGGRRVDAVGDPGQQGEGGGRLEVELGAVGDGDGAGARVDGERGRAAAAGDLPALEGGGGHVAVG